MKEPYPHPSYAGTALLLVAFQAVSGGWLRSGRHQSRRASDLSVLARQRKGWFSVGSTIFAGIDRTSGDSGAFGINKALVITMLFRLEKVG